MGIPPWSDSVLTLDETRELVNLWFTSCAEQYLPSSIYRVCFVEIVHCTDVLMVASVGSPMQNSLVISGLDFGLICNVRGDIPPSQKMEY